LEHEVITARALNYSHEDVHEEAGAFLVVAQA
jgi:hypothetical protein